MMVVFYMRIVREIYFFLLRLVTYFLIMFFN